MEDRAAAFVDADAFVTNALADLKRRVEDLSNAVYAVVVEGSDEYDHDELVGLLHSVNADELTDAADDVLGLADPRQPYARALLRDGSGFRDLDNLWSVSDRASRIRITVVGEDPQEGHWEVALTNEHGRPFYPVSPVRSRTLAVALDRLVGHNKNGHTWALAQEEALLTMLEAEARTIQ